MRNHICLRLLTKACVSIFFLFCTLSLTYLRSETEHYSWHPITASLNLTAIFRLSLHWDIYIGRPVLIVDQITIKTIPLWHEVIDADAFRRVVFCIPVLVDVDPISKAIQLRPSPLSIGGSVRLFFRSTTELASQKHTFQYGQDHWAQHICTFIAHPTNCNGRVDKGDSQECWHGKTRGAPPSSPLSSLLSSGLNSSTIAPLEFDIMEALWSRMLLGKSTDMEEVHGAGPILKSFLSFIIDMPRPLSVREYHFCPCVSLTGFAPWMSRLVVEDGCQATLPLVGRAGMV